MLKKIGAWIWGNRVFLRQNELDQLLKNAYLEGRRKTKIIEREEKRKLCERIWQFYHEVYKEKSETKREQMIETFFNNLIDRQ